MLRACPVSFVCIMNTSDSDRLFSNCDCEEIVWKPHDFSFTYIRFGGIRKTALGIVLVHTTNWTSLISVLLPFQQLQKMNLESFLRNDVLPLPWMEAVSWKFLSFPLKNVALDSDSWIFQHFRQRAFQSNRFLPQVLDRSFVAILAAPIARCSKLLSQSVIHWPFIKMFVSARPSEFLWLELISKVSVYRKVLFLVKVVGKRWCQPCENCSVASQFLKERTFSSISIPLEESRHRHCLHNPPVQTTSNRLDP